MRSSKLGGLTAALALVATALFTSGCADEEIPAPHATESAQADDGVDVDGLTEEARADYLATDDDPADFDFEEDREDDELEAAAEPSEGNVGTTSQAITASRATDKMFGLGVDAPNLFASALWAPLRANWKEGAFSVRTARIVAGTDTNGKLDTVKLRTWVDAVKGQGLEPVVGLSVHRNRLNAATNKNEAISPLAHKTFRSRFWTLLRTFPDVKAWGVVNEPELELNDVKDRAESGALYYLDGYQTLGKCRKKNLCKKDVVLVAGEFSYQGDANSPPFWKRYGDEMGALLKTKKNPKGKLGSMPQRWSLHPYADTTDGTTKGTRSFATFLESLETKHRLKDGKLRIWLTEAGTLLERGSQVKVTCGMSSVNPNGRPEVQYKGAKAVFAMAKNARVDRVYWWHAIQATPFWPGRWDSAMADFSQTPRASFCALTKQPMEACTGEAFARECKP